MPKVVSILLALMPLLLASTSNPYNPHIEEFLALDEVDDEALHRVYFANMSCNS